MELMDLRDVQTPSNQAHKITHSLPADLNDMPHQGNGLFLTSICTCRGVFLSIHLQLSEAVQKIPLSCCVTPLVL